MISLTNSNYNNSANGANAGAPEAGNTSSNIAHSGLSPTTTLSPSGLPVAASLGSGLAGLSQAASSMNTNNTNHNSSISSTSSINRHSISSNSSTNNSDLHIGLSGNGNSNSSFANNSNRSSNSSDFLSTNSFNFGSLPPPTQLNIYPKIKFPSPRFDSLSQQIPFNSSPAGPGVPTGTTASTGGLAGHQPAPLGGVTGHPQTSRSSRKAFKPKAKFTADEDDLLLELKENKKLSWKQIAEHFEGRTAGALQVRYCTKLKGRSLHWSLEDINALHEALEEYDEERWIIVSQKMGSKFTASICRDKFNELSGHGANNNTNYSNRKLFY